MAKETCVEFWLVENRNRSVFLNRSIDPDEFCKSQGSAYRGACKHCAPTCTETVVFCFSLIVFLWTWLIFPLRVIFLPLVSFVFSGCFLNTLVVFPRLCFPLVAFVALVVFFDNISVSGKQKSFNISQSKHRTG